MIQHIAFDPNADSYPIAIVIKDAAFNHQEVVRAYITPLEAMGIPREDIIVLPLKYNKNGKVTVPQAKEYMSELLPTLSEVGVKTIFCCDATYFKVLAKERKAEPHLGYVMKCGSPDYEHIDIIYGINHKQLIHNPAHGSKLDLALATLADSIKGNYSGLGADIVQSAYYPMSFEEKIEAIHSLHQHQSLVCDLETFSLDPFTAGIGSIGFAWTDREGMAFTVDYKSYDSPPQGGLYAWEDRDHSIRFQLQRFFESYKGRILYHNATFDIKVLIAQIWMRDRKDYKGMLRGLHCLTNNFDDTKIIAYLATNTCAGNELGLKDLAHSFAGNYSEDVKNIKAIPEENLLRYNLVDCLSTNWVYDKYYAQMIEDKQHDIYESIMKPSIKTIIQMELVGMPMIPNKIADARSELTHIVSTQNDIITSCDMLETLETELTDRAWEKDYQDRKKKAKNPENIEYKDRSEFPAISFNPGSPKQLQVLLYEVLNLPVLDYTDTRQPATGADTLAKLVNHCRNQDHIELINALIGRGKAEKILSTFIPAFEKGVNKNDGMLWLHGSFNLGGTLSGRLSSSAPNLQNLPSGSTYGKLIKQCFAAPRGWLFCGADWNALEDRINAVLTKDPAKLKVYSDGFDGHSMRAVGYWPDQFPNIDPNDPKQVNTLKDKIWDGKEHPLRAISKGPSFALQYLGTWKTLVNNAGFEPEEAKAIEENYHKLYEHSMEWVKNKIADAAKVGHTTGAFGLRIRTPLLKQTLLGHTNTPREAEAEARSMGNAVSGQSYGLLCNRAANAVMRRVWDSPYKHDILPIAMIHDAIYFICKDDSQVVEFLNKTLVEEMAWQELSEIQNDVVKLEAEMEIFWPNWNYGCDLPVNGTAEEILTTCQQHIEKLRVDHADKRVA